MQILSKMRRRFAEWPKVADAMIKAVIAMARDIATAVDSAGLLRRRRRRWRKWRSDKGKDGVS